MRRAPRFLLVLGLISHWTSGCDAADDVLITSASGYVGRAFVKAEWRVPRDILAKQPRWDGLTSEPPLSPARASALGLPSISAQFPSIQEWRVASIQMRNIFETKDDKTVVHHSNVWLYVIDFLPANEPFPSKFLEKTGNLPLSQVILFDGTVARKRLFPKQ